MRKSHPYDPQFRVEVATKFSQAIKDHKLSKVEAARILNVSRTALYKFLDGKMTPRWEVLGAACTNWNIRLKYRDHEFGKEAFAPVPEAATEEVLPLQMGLFDALERLGNEDLHVKIGSKREDGLLELRLEIKFAG